MHDLSAVQVSCGDRVRACDGGDQPWKPDGVFAAATGTKYGTGLYHTLHASARSTPRSRFNPRLKYNITDSNQQLGYDIESGASA